MVSRSEICFLPFSQISYCNNVCMCKAAKNDRNVHSLTPWQGVYIALSTIDSETKKTIGLL